MLFGGRWSPLPGEKGGEPVASANGAGLTRHSSLLEENRKFGSTPTHPLGAATVFHAGVIGRGRRNGPGGGGGAGTQKRREDVEYNQARTS